MAQKALKFLKDFLRVTVPTLIVLFLLLEIVFRWVIPASERPDGYFDEEYKIVKYDPEAGEGVYTIGPWASQQGRWHINAQGWNSEVDYDPNSKKKKIAVIGDSFVESFQVDVDKSFHHLVAKEMADDCHVMAFGWSGSPLSHYLHVGRYVKAVYDPDVVVVNLVHNDFAQALTEMSPYRGVFNTVQVENGTVTEIEPKPYELSAVKRMMKYSAVFRYIHYNLKIETRWRMMFDGANLTQDSLNYMNMLKSEGERIRLATDYSIGGLRELFADKRLIFMVDCPRPSLYNGTMDKDWQTSFNTLSEEIVAHHGAEFIDLMEVMEADWKENKQFFNTELDLHWNEYGHELVAKTLLAQLRKPAQKFDP